eukprot:Gregarina_sp_Poly_1__4850@NODE_2582_length_1949_cov_4_419235_g1639_i0_p1_GENE_NODE_2582_length_1949_cov_4_419235_g1639_i0NODE_2582_length_1949_cov_4_419235_g1639_i0_p1_ORF_typecomplete_len221_score15_76_NODE_2582_length_1949_cov_4_419235_g1639_i04401102
MSTEVEVLESPCLLYPRMGACLRNLSMIRYGLSMIRYGCQWESQDPVKEVWTAYLEMIPDSSFVASHSRQLPLAHLKFLFALMIQVSPDERKTVSLNTWEEIAFMDPISFDTGDTDNRDWMEHLQYSWHKYCKYLGVSQLFEPDIHVHPQETRCSGLDTNAYEEFLQESAWAMLAETNNGWESPEWRKTIFHRVLFRYLVLAYAREREITGLGRDMQRWI